MNNFLLVSVALLGTLTLVLDLRDRGLVSVPIPKPILHGWFVFGYLGVVFQLFPSPTEMAILFATHFFCFAIGNMWPDDDPEKAEKQ